MYSIHEDTIRVKGESVPTFSRTVEEEEVSFLVEAGSTGLLGGGDVSSPGRTYVSLFCDSPSVYFARVLDKHGRSVGMEVAGCGDDALDGLITSLEFALAALRDARAGVRD